MYEVMIRLIGVPHNAVRWLILLAGFTALMVWSGGMSAAASGVELVNPGFEQGGANGTIPGWQQTYGVGNSALTFERSSAAAKEGAYSLYLNDQSPTASFGVASDLFPVEAGTTYSASVWFQVERETLSIYLQFFDASGTRVGVASASTGVSAEFVKTGVSGTAPEGAVTGSVLLYSASTVQGAGYADQVEVKRMEIGTFENLGQPIMNFIHQDAAFGVEQGKEVAYTVVKGADDSTVFAVIDLETEAVIRTIPMPGVTGAWGVKTATDGSVYAGTHYNGRLYRYVPGASSLTDLGQLGAETHIWELVAGADGKMYAGTYPNAHVYEYDPATGQLTDLGRVHPTEKYVRSLAYDDDRNVLYAGVGGATAGIVKIDLGDGTKEEILSQLLPQAYSQYDFAYSMDYALGKLFVRLNKPDHLLIVDTATGTVEYYNPSSGIGMGSRVVVTKPGDDRTVYFGGFVLRAYDTVTKTLSVAYPNSQMRGFNLFEGRFVQRSDPAWPGYTLVGFSEKGQYMAFNEQTGTLATYKVANFGSPILIQSVNAGFDGNIYIGGYLGATGFTAYRPADGTFGEVQQFGQVESVSSVNGKLYIGTYGNARIHEYDPALPWSSSNPRRVAELVSHGQDRPFALLGVDALNKLYIGSVPDYGSHSGALTVYDPATGSVQVHKDIVANQGVVSLTYHNGIVYGGTTIYGGLGTSGPAETEGKLFAFDTATGAKLYELVPVAGRKAVSGLLTGQDGLIWGVAEDTIFKLDPQSGQVVYTAAKLGRYGSTATVWADAFLEWGQDGQVYGTNRQQTFFKIDPATMEFNVLKSNAGKYLTQDLDGNLYMSNDSYLWKYTIPEEETQATATLEGMRERLDGYEARGAVQAVFAGELRYRLMIISQLVQQGALNQAGAYMEDFARHIQDSAVLQQGLLLREAADELANDAAALTEQWMAMS